MGTFQGYLTEHVYLLNRQRILRGELPFGTDLSRRELAEQLGGRPVRLNDDRCRQLAVD